MMIANFSFESTQWWHLAGWTMAHFLWLGAIAGVAALVCRLVLRRAAANVRYSAALVWFALLAALPVAIAAWVVANGEQATPQAVVLAPLVESPVSFAEVSPHSVEAADAFASSIPAPTSELSDTHIPPATERDPSPASGVLPLAVFASEQLARYLPWLWLGAPPLTFALLATGIVGAERLRRTSRVIHDGPLAQECARLIQLLRISRRVTLAVCERIAAPVLVGILRPVILLPPSALTGWSPDEIEMVLLHELAHVRRWDNLVNLLQRLVESLLFFHPAVWLVSAWVRREREACCDAVVVGRTNRPHAYAEMLVALAAQMPRSVLFHPAASSAMAAGPLRSRIRRILQMEDDPMLVSGKSLAVVMSGLLLAATLVVLNLPTHSRAGESATEDTENSAVDVAFVEGASRFEDGDSITITQVRGNSKTFEPGNTYWIEGTYTLASRDRASLSVFVTARNAGDGRTSIDKDQTMIVERGSGEFRLKLLMPYDGWPHVSYYPAEGGEGFGGVYFGTGDSVLENWSKVYGPDDTRSAESHTEVDRGKFPSLEEQKLADLAYAALQLELEAINNKELARVKKLGYDGGVRVTANPLGGSIQVDDILVGLHVWPTTSLEDVVAVLRRDDLAELNPLKHYVARSIPQRFDADKWGPDAYDMVVTGRISVNVPSRPQRTSAASDRYSATAIPTPIQAPGTAHPNVPGELDSDPALRYDGKTFDQWRHAWRTELSTEKRLEAVKALAAFGSSGYGKEAAQAIVEVAPQYGVGAWLEAISAADSIKQLQGRALLVEMLHALGIGNTRQSPFSISFDDSLSALETAARSDEMKDRQFAAIILGRMVNFSKAEAALIPLLFDEEEAVRALALQIYCRLKESKQIAIDHLKQVINENPSPEIVARARDALKFIEERAGESFGSAATFRPGPASPKDE